MEKDLFTAIVSITTAIVGVAILSVLVSKNSNTEGIISASSTGYSNILSTALSPVTGGSNNFASLSSPTLTF